MLCFIFFVVLGLFALDHNKDSLFMQRKRNACSIKRNCLCERTMKKDLNPNALPYHEKPKKLPTKRKLQARAVRVAKPPEVTYQAVYDLSTIHCTASEIASVLHCDEKLLYDRFPDAMHKGREDGKKSLKRKMFEKALSGDTTMLIWLSKQYLGHRDRHPDEAPLTQYNVYLNDMPVPKTVIHKRPEIEHKDKD